MIYLVTGGSGFIGSHIIHQLLKKNVKIVAYDTNIKSTPMQMILCNQEIAKVKWVQGNIGNLHLLLNVIRQENIQKIIHLSAVMFPISEAVNFIFTSQ